MGFNAGLTVEDHNDFLSEINMEEYRTDFDWREELYQGGYYDMYYERFHNYNTVLPSWHKEVNEMVTFFDQFK